MPVESSTLPPYTVPSYTVPPYTYPPGVPPSYSIPPYTVPPYTYPPSIMPTYNFTFTWLSEFSGGLATFVSILLCISNCLLCHACYVKQNKKQRVRKREKNNRGGTTPLSSAGISRAENRVILYQYGDSTDTKLTVPEPKSEAAPAESLRTKERLNGY